MVSLGKWAAQEACRQSRLWQERYPHEPPLLVSVNLSVSQLQNPTLVQEFAQLLEESGADLSSIELEITENVLMRYEEGLFEALTELKSLGVRLAIDDFGTGYSSLSHLNRLPVDTLKIDKSFIERIGEDPKARLITSATIGLAKTLGLEVVAEGIETAEQLRELKELGCALGQGYYLARPMTSEEAAALIAEGSSLRAS
jgi:EAL domain-containing protein (putative c-di-GMP-specific phosphodiesterase class I)